MFVNEKSLQLEKLIKNPGKPIGFPSKDRIRVAFQVPEFTDRFRLSRHC